MILCNPMPIAYKYQHPLHGKFAYREAADPTIVRFKGKYFLFTSKCGGFYWSENLNEWRFHEDRTLDIHGYAPDVSVDGEYMYFCASAYLSKCRIWRSKDPFKGFEVVSRPFAFWDPHILFDEKRAYLFWGCSSKQPIFGIELDKKTMTPVGDKVPIVSGDPERHGIDDKSVYAGEKRSLWQRYIALFTGSGTFIEGAYVNKIGGRYYFQYATPGTEYPTYGDAVLTADKPLGKYVWQKHNPFSVVPGGFTQGAGHGSTFEDEFGNLWHAASVCVGVNHNFERRLGLWPAGVDKDGVMFCNQYFADYPKDIPKGRFDPMSVMPAFMLLSYGKRVSASSERAGHEAKYAVDESMKTSWSAQSGKEGEWLSVDLGKRCDVRAVQVNFADVETPKKKAPRKEYGGTISQERYIDEQEGEYSYALSVSEDGKIWKEFCGGNTKLPHKLWEGEAKARFVRIELKSLPYGNFALCGLRVFGFAGGAAPEKTNATAARTSATRAVIEWKEVEGATGYHLRFGIAPDKLYSGMIVYGDTRREITFLNAEAEEYYVAVDVFNESGLTQGDVFKMSGGKNV